MIRRLLAKAVHGIAAIPRDAAFGLLPAAESRRTPALDQGFLDAPEEGGLSSLLRACSEGMEGEAVGTAGSGLIWRNRSLPLHDEGTWRRDPVSGCEMPDIPFQRIDFAPGSMPDPVPYWEVTRLSFAPVLAGTYRLTGNRSFLDALGTTLASFSRSCPAWRGVAWSTGLEVGLRAVNLLLCASSLTQEGRTSLGLRGLLWRHAAYLWHTDVKRRRSPANNHLLGAMTGLMAASVAFEGRRPAMMFAEAAAIMAEEIRRQFLADGGGIESSTPYHHFSLEVSLLALRLARASSLKWPREAGPMLEPGVTERLSAAADLVQDFEELLAMPPGLGDGSDLWIIPPAPDAFGRADDPVRVMKIAREILGGHHPKDHGAGFRHSFRPASGLLVARTDHYGACLSSMPFRAGFGGHAHHDLGSIVVSVRGDPLVVDPGTFCYMHNPPARESYRSTRSHNTLVVDGVEQVEKVERGLFARFAPYASFISASDGDGRTWRTGHDGYARLGVSAVVRSVTFGDYHITVTDEIECSGSHAVEIPFHLAPGLEVETTGQRCAVVMSRGTAVAIFEADDGLTIETGEYDHSPRYLESVPAVVVRLHGTACGAARFISRIRIGEGCD